MWVPEFVGSLSIYAKTYKVETQYRTDAMHRVSIYMTVQPQFALRRYRHHLLELACE